MNEQMRWPMVNLSRAGIFFVVGVIGVGIGVAADLSPLAVVGGFALFIGVMYLLAGLIGLSKAFMAED